MEGENIISVVVWVELDNDMRTEIERIQLSRMAKQRGRGEREGEREKDRERERLTVDYLLLYSTVWMTSMAFSQ